MSSKKSKEKRSLIISVVSIVFFVYVGYTFITQQITINNKKAELEAINEQMVAEQAEKKALEQEKKTVNTPEYIEEVARTELDYAAPDEIIFVDATAED